MGKIIGSIKEVSTSKSGKKALIIGAIHTLGIFATYCYEKLIGLSWLENTLGFNTFQASRFLTLIGLYFIIVTLCSFSNFIVILGDEIRLSGFKEL